MERGGSTSERPVSNLLHRDPARVCAPYIAAPKRLRSHQLVASLSTEWASLISDTRTNNRIEAWAEMLAGDEVLPTATFDRLLRHSHGLNIKGRPYRLRDLESPLATANARWPPESMRLPGDGPGVVTCC